MEGKLHLLSIALKNDEGEYAVMTSGKPYNYLPLYLCRPDIVTWTSNKDCALKTDLEGAIILKTYLDNGHNDGDPVLIIRLIKESK